MNTQKLILILSTMVLAILAGLVWLAVQGVTLAIVILTVLATVGLIGVGVGFTLIHIKIAADRQQAQFTDNASENLQIMSAMQSVQNKQNQTLMSQLGAAHRLPQAPPQANGNFLIESGIFDDLEAD